MSSNVKKSNEESLELFVNSKYTAYCITLPHSACRKV